MYANCSSSPFIWMIHYCRSKNRTAVDHYSNVYCWDDSDLKSNVKEKSGCFQSTNDSKNGQNIIRKKLIEFEHKISNQMKIFSEVFNSYHNDNIMSIMNSLVFSFYLVLYNTNHSNRQISFALHPKVGVLLVLFFNFLQLEISWFLYGLEIWFRILFVNHDEQIRSH